MDTLDKRRVNVRAIIYKDGKILAVKHKSPTGEVAEYWATPGGGLDSHESLQDGVAREVMEETGIEARVGRLLFVQQFPSKREGYEEELEFIFLIDNPDDFEAIDLANTTHGHLELAKCEFIDPTQEYILPAFLSEVPLKEYCESVKPVYFLNELQAAE